jgi:negative regulator of sigma E activity
MYEGKKIRKRDLEKLSAYLDGELQDRDLQRFESRLVEDPSLQLALQELAETKQMLGQLPQVRPPRHFILTPEMVEQKPRLNLFPVFRFATVVATALFAVLVGVDVFMPTGFETAQLSQPPSRELDFEAGGVDESLATDAIAEAPMAAALEDTAQEDAAEEAVESDRATDEASEQGILPQGTPTPAPIGLGEGQPMFGVITEPAEARESETVTPMAEDLSPQMTATLAEPSDGLEEPPVPATASEPLAEETNIEYTSTSGGTNLLKKAEIAVGIAVILLALGTYLLRRMA